MQHQEQPSKPIVVQVVKQPAETESISYGGILLSAVGLVGLILLLAFIVGGVVGGVIILKKRREDRSAPPTDPGHAKLRI